MHALQELKTITTANGDLPLKREQDSQNHPRCNCELANSVKQRKSTTTNRLVNVNFNGA